MIYTQTESAARGWTTDRLWGGGVAFSRVGWGPPIPRQGGRRTPQGKPAPSHRMLPLRRKPPQWKRGGGDPVAPKGLWGGGLCLVFTHVLPFPGKYR